MPPIFSKKFVLPVLVVALLSAALLFLPLAGALGFEFSVVIAFAGAFAAVFISAEYTLEARKFASRGITLADTAASITLINLILLAMPFAIGLLGSLLQGDCSIAEGILFYILIPTVSVFFASPLGILLESLLPRKGFFLGALVLIGTVLFSLWRIYGETPVFSYNPVFGYFPGPLYDEAIPVTATLVLYRVNILCWGAMFLVASSFIFARRQVGGGVRMPALLALIPIAALICVFTIKREDFGFIYGRDYIARNFLQAGIETEHFIIRYSPDSPEARNIKLIADDHEWRYYQLEKFLNVRSKVKIRSYIYPDEKTRKKIIGAGETTVANPIHREIHLVYDGFPHPVLKHELTHVMSSEFGTKILGISPKVGLVEGLAVAADWSENGFTPHEWSRAMIESNGAPAIEDIVGFGFWYAPPRKSYTLMGSFSRYLIDRYGIERFKYLYRTGDFAVYKKTLSGLISEWKGFVQKIPISEDAPALAGYRFGAPSVFGAKCARKVALLKERGFDAFQAGNLFEARNFFSEALGFDGRDASLSQSLAYSCYYQGDFAEAVRVAEKSHSDISEVDRNILSNLRANALWQSGKSKDALSIFESLGRKPLPSDVEREIEIKLSAFAEGGAVENQIKNYFAVRDRITQAAVLTELLREYPEYAPAHYLLGRIFFNLGDYERASPPLGKALTLGLPSDNLARENSRILGVSLYALGRYDEAEDVFRRAAQKTSEGNFGGYAGDFIERCLWAKARNLN